MKKSSIFRNSLFLVTFLFALSCKLSNQANIKGKDEVAYIPIRNGDIISKSAESPLEINQEGWELPDLNKLKIEEKQEKIGIKSPKPVTLKRYFPKVEELLLKTSLGEMQVLSVREFEIENRKFCYILTVIKPKPKDSNFSRAGITTNLTYYDLDGDGRFETHDHRYGAVPIIFPKWLEN